MGKIIAVANQKGGVGKTTTSVNLSACLAEQGKKTLLIDTDPQGNATSGIGIDKDSLSASVYDVLINDKEFSDCTTKTKYNNLYICPSNIELAGAEIELVSSSNREYRLKNKLCTIKNDYDYIIVDCPPALGLITLNVFIACDTVLVPIQCEYYALEGLSQLTSTLRSVKNNYNPSLEIEGVLATMFDGRTNLSIQVLDEVKSYFGRKVYKTVIPRNVKLSEAPSFGQAVIEYDKYSKGAQTYRDLAEELIGINEGS